MKTFRPFLSAALLASLTYGQAATPDFRSRSYDFPIYKNAPPGRQMTGQHVAAGTPERRSTNPAWDFQWIISPNEVLKPYEHCVRTVLRPRCSRQEIVEEYNRWRAGGSSGSRKHLPDGRCRSHF